MVEEGIEGAPYTYVEVVFPDLRLHKILHDTLVGSEYRESMLKAVPHKVIDRYGFNIYGSFFDLQYREKNGSRPSDIIVTLRTYPYITIESKDIKSIHNTPCSSIGLTNIVGNDKIWTGYKDTGKRNEGYFLFRDHERYLDDNPELRIMHEVSFLFGNSIIDYVKKEMDFNRHYHDMKKKQMWSF